MENDWDVVHNDRGGWSGGAGMGILRIALLFGSVAIALALILTPLLDGETRYADGGQPFGVDDEATGSIGKGNTYTIRRSVLQSTPDAVCVIDSNGRESGDC
jgi:hypothetical protein